MSKYNLMDMLPEGMSDKEYAAAQEKDRLEKHPEADKIKAVQAMVKNANSIEEDNLDEMRNVDYERLDGMIDQSLLNKLLNTAVSIKLDFEANDEPFENSDIVDFLANLMEKRLDQVDDTPSQDEMDPDDRERQSIDMDDVREHFNRFK